MHRCPDVPVRGLALIKLDADMSIATIRILWGEERSCSTA